MPPHPESEFRQVVAQFPAPGSEFAAQLTHLAARLAANAPHLVTELVLPAGRVEPHPERRNVDSADPAARHFDPIQPVHPIQANPGQVHPIQPDSGVIHPVQPNPRNVHPIESDPRNVHPIEPDARNVHPIHADPGNDDGLPEPEGEVLVVEPVPEPLPEPFGPFAHPSFHPLFPLPPAIRLALRLLSHGRPRQDRHAKGRPPELRTHPDLQVWLTRNTTLMLLGPKPLRQDTSHDKSDTDAWFLQRARGGAVRPAGSAACPGWYFPASASSPAPRSPPVNRLLRLLPIVAVLAGPVAAQGPVTVPGSERYLMKANATGIEYQVEVALPSGYQTSGKRYPVFYVLDGNLAFTTLVDTYRMLRIDNAVPELILVGIGYPEDDPAVYTPAYHASRSRDYTHTSFDSSLAGSGGARAFLSFVATELIPVIDGRYRTDPTDRGLGGHSLGGLFTTYALLTEPTVFRRYWIGSPSLWWDGKAIFKALAPARARPNQPTGRAFLTVGALETDVMVPPMRRMATELTAAFPTLEVGSIVYPDETHMSVVGGSISRALRFLYARPRIALRPADRAQLAGLWKSESGDTLRITPQARGLLATMVVFGNPVAADMAAETRDRLFGTNLAVELQVERDAAGRPVRIRRSMLGGEAVFQRARP